jgi:GMP synthase-like glutamine amidotransferase
MVELIYLIKENEVFFEGVSVNSQVWMSHSDSVKASYKWSKASQYP